MASFTVCAVSKNDWKYLVFQDRLMRHLAADPDFDRITIHVGEDPRDAERLARLPGSRVHRADLGRRRGSMAHGVALNHLMRLLPEVKTEYVLIVDPDCVPLVQSWDRMCTAALVDDCVAVGAPYAGWAAEFRHGEVPTAVFMFCRTGPLRELRMDWRPHPDWYRYVRYEVAPRLGIPFRRDRDVGWRLPGLLARRGWSSRVFEALTGRDANSIVLAPDGRGDEFHWEGRAFATHQGRSVSREFYEDPVSRTWVEKVCAYLGVSPEEAGATRLSAAGAAEGL